MTTRFEDEIKGLFGEYWRKSAQADVEKRVQEYNDGELLIDENGVASWKNSGNIVPEDIAQMAEYGGLPVNIEATRKARDEEMTAFIAEYRERQANREPDPEELFEMRAAFGTGTVVVNVFTGREIRL